MIVRASTRGQANGSADAASSWGRQRDRAPRESDAWGADVPSTSCKYST